MSVEKQCVSVVTLLHGESQFIPLIKDNFRGLLETQTLELVVVDDGPVSLASEFSDIDNCLYFHLDDSEKTKFGVQILEGYKQPNKGPLQYQALIKTLPNGFKRDYGCGMSSYPYIFHMNADCVYNPKSIDRKCRFAKRVSAECVYTDTTLAYDIYNRKLYKTISPHKIYESTLFHTREFWKRRGFQWSDVEMEGKYFHHDNGIDRKLDNYYDVVQLLSVHNLNKYNPVEVTVDGIDIKIPELAHEIHIQTHPFVKTIRDIYDTTEVQILGIESEFLENISEENWTVTNRTGKWKQTKLAKEIKQTSESFNVLLYGSKHPAWDFFEHIAFDLIFLETRHNWEQMSGIIIGCKKHSYIYVNGVFVRKEYLEGSDLKE